MGWIPAPGWAESSELGWAEIPSADFHLPGWAESPLWDPAGLWQVTRIRLGHFSAPGWAAMIFLL